MLACMKLFGKASGLTTSSIFFCIGFSLSLLLTLLLSYSVCAHIFVCVPCVHSLLFHFIQSISHQNRVSFVFEHRIQAAHKHLPSSLFEANEILCTFISHISAAAHSIPSQHRFRSDRLSHTHPYTFFSCMHGGDFKLFLDCSILYALSISLSTSIPFSLNAHHFYLYITLFMLRKHLKLHTIDFVICIDELRMHQIH